MPPIDVVDRADSQPATRTALPDPGEQVPKLAWPTVALFLAGAVAFVASTVAYLVGAAPTWVPIVVNAVVTFTMFTVLHDAVHYAISSTRWVNGLVGRFAVLFVQPMISFPRSASFTLSTTGIRTTTRTIRIPSPPMGRCGSCRSAGQCSTSSTVAI